MTTSSGNTITLTELKVDLPTLEKTIQTVTAQQKAIDDACNLISTNLNNLDQWWAGPAEGCMTQVGQICIAQMGNLMNLLKEMLSRMQTAYNNYLDMEQANYHNMQH